MDQYGSVRISTMYEDEQAEEDALTRLREKIDLCRQTKPVDPSTTSGTTHDEAPK